MHDPYLCPRLDSVFYVYIIVICLKPGPYIAIAWARNVYYF